MVSQQTELFQSIIIRISVVVMILVLFVVAVECLCELYVEFSIKSLETNLANFHLI